MIVQLISVTITCPFCDTKPEPVICRNQKSDETLEDYNYYIQKRVNHYHRINHSMCEALVTIKMPATQDTLDYGKRSR